MRCRRDAEAPDRHSGEEELNSVRSRVARNSSTPASVLETLAKDKSKYVRRDVAANIPSAEGLLDARTNKQCVPHKIVAVRFQLP